MATFLRHLARPFHTLQWRFAVSYMLVTVVTVALLPVVYSLASFFFVIRTPDLPRDMAAALEGVTPQVLPYIVSTPPDRDGLRRWLVNFNSTGRLQARANFADLWMSGPPYGTSVLGVVDPSGQVIAATGQSDALFDSRLGEQAHQVVAAALTGDTRLANLVTPEHNGRAEIAVPVTVPGHVLGALVLNMDVQATRSDFFPRSALPVLGFIFLLALGSGFMGLIFGFIISRGLARRLKRIAHAAKAWSQGDFAVAARDTSGDELGRLARDLDRMAEQFKGLLEDRRQLATIEERNRLARDLHDSVKQQVFAASMQVAAARALVRRDPDTAEARLGEVERAVGEAQRELSTLILELRPVALANKGLALALRDYCDEWSRRTGIGARMQIQDERATPLDVEQALFRVAQEALANIARHSGATSADVHLTWTPDAVILTVTDNGHGFDIVTADGKGVGLHSMRERAEAIGGALAITRAIGETGTSVELTVPLDFTQPTANLTSADGTR